MPGEFYHGRYGRSDRYFEAGAWTLGVSAAEALAIEDSPNGVRATQQAGIRCVVVPNELTRKMRFPEEVEVLDSLENFSLNEYLKGHQQPGDLTNAKVFSKKLGQKDERG